MIVRDRDLQRVDGAARIAVKGELRRVAITDLYQRSPCKVLLPRIDGQDLREAVFLNTTGGIAGGDRLRFEVSASGDATFTATTQTAERVYRAIDAAGRVETRIEARDAATLEWLPQETILFDRGRLHRSTEVRLSHSARLIAMDWLLLGRSASGETVRSGAFRDNWRVFRDGRLVWADALRLDGDIAGLASRAALLGGHTAIATILYGAADAAGQLDRARDLLARPGCKAGATVVNGLMICRFAAKAAAELRAAVSDFLRAFRDGLDGFAAPLPRVWAC
ncbi:MULTISPECIES: urease accessory protein UreD [Rhodomicrobium]|uniref:urease accessory protein UreD n=1 Tax=Rhodomicrobium TaxID=1068 RepID=UPI001FD9B593|nr:MULTISPECIES: urease accessory protein UreD [Rhodomicrobium]